MKAILKNSEFLSKGVGSQGGSVVKNPPDNIGASGSIPGPGRSLEEEMATHSRGQRSLEGYSPWVTKSRTAERLNSSHNLEFHVGDDLPEFREV